MISYTQALTTLQSFLKYDSNDTTTNTFVLSLFNDSVRAVCAVRPWWFLYSAKDFASQASVSVYPTSPRIREITEVYATVGTIIYRPRPVYDEETWTRIKQSNLGESDTPMFYKVSGNSIEFSPTPASTDITFTLKGRLRPRDLNSASADYATGTISAVTSGAKVLTGSGTSWNSTMVGKLIRITNTAAANGGDGYWYEIASVASTTSLTLVEPYEGASISGGSASYTISDVMPIPEEWQLAPIYRTKALYEAVNDPANPKMSMMWWNLYDGGEEAGLSKETGGILAKMKEAEGSTVADKYLSPTGYLIDPNYPPRDASGFN